MSELEELLAEAKMHAEQLRAEGMSGRAKIMEELIVAAAPVTPHVTSAFKSLPENLNAEARDSSSPQVTSDRQGVSVLPTIAAAEGKRAGDSSSHPQSEIDEIQATLQGAQVTSDPVVAKLIEEHGHRKARGARVVEKAMELSAITPFSLRESLDALIQTTDLWDELIALRAASRPSVAGEGNTAQCAKCRVVVTDQTPSAFYLAHDDRCSGELREPPVVSVEGEREALIEALKNLQMVEDGLDKYVIPFGLWGAIADALLAGFSITRKETKQ